MTSINPTITGTVGNQSTASDAPVEPFSGVIITDPNDGGTDTDTLTIAFSGGGTLADGAGFTGTGTLTGSSGSYTLTGTASDITTELDALSFTPAGVPNTAVATIFTLNDSNSVAATSASDSNTSVVDSDPAVAPTISGTVAHQATASDAPVEPFSGVIITDRNDGGTDTDTLTITFSGGGTLVDGAGFTGTRTLSGSNGSYTLTGTASAITTELDALSFTPAGVPNTAVTRGFTLKDANPAAVTSASDSNTSVIDSDPAVAPTISGTVAHQATASDAPVNPFSGVTIADRNDGGTDTDTLTIAFSGSGSLANGAGFTGTSTLTGSNGSYTLTGTAAAITTELDALSFTPAGVPNTAVTTGFTLNDSNSAAATSASDSTTSVIDTDPAVAQAITGTVAHQTTVFENPATPFSGVTIADRNDGGTDTDTLTIAFSGPGTLADGAGFMGTRTLSGSNGTYTLTGTAADITAELDALSFTPVDGVTNASVTTNFTLADAGTVTPGALASIPFVNIPSFIPFASSAGRLIADTAGDLFGTTANVEDPGKVFELVNTGTVDTPVYGSLATTLVQFAQFVPLGSSPNAAGYFPVDGVIIDGAGDLIGTTTQSGGIFEVVNTGTVSAPVYDSVPVLLYALPGSGTIEAGLISDAAGDLFGMTVGGNARGGTVYELVNTGTVSAPAYGSPPTTLTLLPESPPSGRLLLDAAGDLLGTTFDAFDLAGGGDRGSVFELVNTGTVNAPVYGSTFITLYTFTGGADGANPNGPVISDAAGNLFGTTRYDGSGTILTGGGTVFEIANTGTVNAPVYSSTLTALVIFNGTDGAGPQGGLISDAAGDLFGTTESGGAFNAGTVFELVNTGTVGAPIYSSTPTTLHSFTDGNSTPQAALTSDAAGDLFGTTTNRNASTTGISGTVFELAKAGSTYIFGAAVDGTTSVVDSDPLVPVTVSAPGGIDLTWGTLYDELANSPIAAGGSATQFTAVDSGHFNGHSAAIRFVITGTGFTYGGSAPNIQLTGGFITGIEEQDNSGNPLAAYTSLSMSATAFQSALDSYTSAGSANPAALNAIFLALPFSVTGAGGAELLQGGNLADTFHPGTGNDTVNGGSQTNTADYSNLTTPGFFAIVQGGNGTVQKGGANGKDTLTGVQALVDNGTGRGNGDVFEVDSAETVTANSNNFNYLIELSAGVNLAYGANFTGITEFVSNLGANTVSFASDSHFAYLFGSKGNDTLTLGSGGGYLIGEGGINTLTGGANATNLFVGGQGGFDIMNGGTGTASNFYFVDGIDEVNGAGAFNTMIELVSDVSVQLGSAQYAHVQEFVSNGGDNAATVADTDSDFTYLYGGTGNDTLSTGSGGGYMIGEGGTNVLSGGGGLNVFVADGASGADTMNGGSGSNVYFIDANSTVHGAGTFNTVIELQQNASLTLGSTQLGSDIQQVVFNGGTNSADFHTATSAVFLYGGSGNDTLFGGTGNDFLFGGLGTNTFKFATGWGHDTVMDWTAGTNSQIDLTALAGLGVHATTDLTQTITGGNDVITSSHTGTNSITLMGVGAALTTSSFHFA